MLVGKNSGNRYAQIGYGYFRNYFGQTGLFTFTQYRQCLTCDPATRYADPPTTGYFYKVSYNFTEKRLSMIRGSTSFAVTPWDPFSFWATPFQSQYMGETNYRESDVIGIQSTAASFGGIEKRNGDGSWSTDPNLKLVPSTGPRYHSKWGQQPTLFYIWTFPLS
jgi:hypothetical protein